MRGDYRFKRGPSKVKEERLISSGKKDLEEFNVAFVLQVGLQIRVGVILIED